MTSRHSSCAPVATCNTGDLQPAARTYGLYTSSLMPHRRVLACCGGGGRSEGAVKLRRGSAGGALASSDHRCRAAAAVRALMRRTRAVGAVLLRRCAHLEDAAGELWVRAAGRELCERAPAPLRAIISRACCSPKACESSTKKKVNKQVQKQKPVLCRGQTARSCALPKKKNPRISQRTIFFCFFLQASLT